MGTKYIQKKNGHMAGSIGEGKENVPTVGTSQGRPALPRFDEPNYAATHERYEEIAARQVREAAAVTTSDDIDLDVFRVETSYPVPQANSLTKVAAAVDAIADGASTDDAVAHAIGVTPRQGAYYANAAAYLGFVTESPSALPREWNTTVAGAQFLNANAATRAEILSHVVSQIPEVDAVLNDGAEADEMYAANLSDSTATRRAATLNAWLDTLTDKDAAVSSLELETDGVRDRIDAARQVAADARQAARRKAQTERQGQVCKRCFTMMPLSGNCPACDD